MPLIVLSGDMEKELIKLFEEMIQDIDNNQPAGNAWGAGSWEREGNLRDIAKSITFFDFMNWLVTKPRKI